MVLSGSMSCREKVEVVSLQLACVFLINYLILCGGFGSTNDAYQYVWLY